LKFVRDKKSVLHTSYSSRICVAFSALSKCKLPVIGVHVEKVFADNYSEYHYLKTVLVSLI